MKQFLKAFARLNVLFFIVLISIIIALTRSSGSVNFGLWFYGAIFLVGFIILFAVHAAKKRRNRISIRIALLAESITLLNSSMLMGGNDQSFGYSDPYSVTFFGKTYLPSDPAHDRIETFINIVTAVWVISFLAILFTIFISLFLQNLDTKEKVSRQLFEQEGERKGQNDRLAVINIFHILFAFISMALITSNFPKTQDPYRSFVDKGFIISILWLCFFISIIMFLRSKKPLRYPILMYIYQVVGVIAALSAYSRTKDLYAVRYSTEVTTLKVISLVSMTLVIVMLIRSAFYNYHKSQLKNDVVVDEARGI